MGITTVPAGELLLYYSWQGLTLIHPTPVRFAVATPGLFGVALNEDGGLNSAAAPGSVLQVYATGLGAIDTNPALGDFLPLNGLTRTVNPVTATVGGVAAEVQFAGGAPGQIGGLYKVNVRVPSDVQAGPAPLVLRVAEQASNALTVWVR